MTPATDAAREARAHEILAAEYERTATGGKHVARDIRAGILSSEGERAIRAMLAFADTEAASQPREGGKSLGPHAVTVEGDCSPVSALTASYVYLSQGDDQVVMTHEMWRAVQDALTQRPPEQAGAVPAGWKLVPVEPDALMLTHGHDAVGVYRCMQVDIRRAWSAMLSAAPSAPATEAGATASQLVEKWELEYMACHDDHWGDSIAWQGAREIARRIDAERLHSPSNGALPAGMVRWDGGDRAPDNWDGGDVLLEDGTMGDGNVWDHHPSRAPTRIIAYTLKTSATPTDQVKDGKGGGA